MTIVRWDPFSQVEDLKTIVNAIGDYATPPQ